MDVKQKRQFLQLNLSLNKVVDVSYHFFQPHLHAIQLVEPLEKWTYRAHYHSYFELIVPLRNTYECSLNHLILKIPAGFFLLIQPGQLHQDFYEKDSSFRVFQFYLDHEEQMKTFSSFFRPDILPKDQIAPFPAFASKLSDMLFDAVSHKLPDTVSDSLFSSLFWLLAASFPPELMRQTDTGNSENILQYRINCLFLKFLKDGDFSMEQLQNNFHVSRRTLDHICYRIFNHPPAKAFQVFRCQFVRKFLLEHPEASLKDTAQLFHFHDQFSMSRSFRQVYGYPPSDVQKHLNVDESNTKE